jgi:hypothetical protein
MATPAPKTPAVAPPADTDPFADAFAGLSALKDDASTVAISAAMTSQTAGPTGPTGSATTDGPTGPTGSATTDGPTGPTGVAEEVVEDAMAAAAAAAAAGPTGPTGTPAAIGPTGAATGPTAPGFVDTKTFNELVAALKGAAAPAGDDQRVTQPQPEPLTAEETEALNTFVTEFPQVAAAQQIMMRRSLEATASYVLAEVASVLQPMMQRLELLGQRSHLGDLEAVVPDYADVRQQVVDWVATQPPYLQVAYNSVIQQGTVDEVKDLIDRFRGATGKVVTPGDAAQKPAIELPAAAKKAAAALAPVSAKRSTATTSAPSGFDEAFESFAKLE